MVTSARSEAVRQASDARFVVVSTGIIGGIHNIRFWRHPQKGQQMANEGDTGQYEVMIEGETHLWAEDTISVTDIRKLGNLPEDASIVEQNLRDGTERTLTEDEALRPGKLKEGKRLTKKRVNFRKE